MSKKPTNARKEFEKALADADNARYVLRLYVAGATPKSTQAIANLKALCEKYLEGRYDLEVIDVYQQPDRAQNEQIVAVPTLIKELPPPLRKLVGDMSNEERVLVGLYLRQKDEG